MSGKQCITQIEKITSGNIIFGKIEDAESVNSKFSKCKVGVQGMDPAKLTCITKGKFKDVPFILISETEVTQPLGFHSE